MHEVLIFHAEIAIVVNLLAFFNSNMEYFKNQRGPRDLEIFSDLFLASLVSRVSL
jgi:hypothetical protein